jgi:hypothetical protein
MAARQTEADTEAGTGTNGSRNKKLPRKTDAETGKRKQIYKDRNKARYPIVKHSHISYRPTFL